MRKAEVRQMLFEMTAMDGTDFAFAVLTDDRCAILRDGEFVEVSLTDERSLGRAVRLYFAMIDHCGGARHPFQVIETAGHPHVG